jgi:hypothetical protein
MSRSGYSDDCDGWDLIRWRGAVASAIRGKRGQDFLREMAAALDALPEKLLIAEELEKDGEVCALGAVGKARGIYMGSIDPEEREDVALAFGIPKALACEIMYENDDYWKETPQHRWQRMRDWVQKQLATGNVT